MSGAFGLQTGGAGLNFLAQSGMARVLGTAAFGQYSLVFNLVQLVALPIDLGASTSVTRFLPQYAVQGHERLRRGFVLLSCLIPICLGALIAAGGATFLLLNGRQESVALVVLAAASLPFFALVTVLMNTLRACGSIVMAFGPPLVLQPLILLLAVLIVPDPDVEALAGATVAGVVAAAVLQLAALRRTVPGLGTGSRSYALREWRDVSLPLLFVNVLQLVFQRLDILAVGALLGVRAAGVYAIANRLAVAAASLQKAMLTVVAPQMSTLHWSGERRQVEDLVLRGLRLAFVPAALVTVLLAVLGKPILELISPAYGAGWAALVIYSIGQLFSVASGPVGWLAAVIGEQRRLVGVTILSALVAVVGYAVLIPTLGIAGAAAANSLGVICRNVASERLCRSHGFRISLVRALARRPHDG